MSCENVLCLLCKFPARSLEVELDFFLFLSFSQILDLTYLRTDERSRWSWTFRGLFPIWSFFFCLLHTHCLPRERETSQFLVSALVHRLIETELPETKSVAATCSRPGNYWSGWIGREKEERYQVEGGKKWGGVVKRWREWTQRIFLAVAELLVGLMPEVIRLQKRAGEEEILGRYSDISNYHQFFHCKLDPVVQAWNVALPHGQGVVGASLSVHNYRHRPHDSDMSQMCDGEPELWAIWIQSNVSVLNRGIFKLKVVLDCRNWI